MRKSSQVIIKTKIFRKASFQMQISLIYWKKRPSRSNNPNQCQNVFSFQCSSCTGTEVRPSVLSLLILLSLLWFYCLVPSRSTLVASNCLRDFSHGDCQRLLPRPPLLESWVLRWVQLWCLLGTCSTCEHRALWMLLHGSRHTGCHCFQSELSKDFL